MGHAAEEIQVVPAPKITARLTVVVVCPSWTDARPLPRRRRRESCGLHPKPLDPDWSGAGHFRGSHRTALRHCASRPCVARHDDNTAV